MCILPVTDVTTPMGLGFQRLEALYLEPRGLAQQECVVRVEMVVDYHDEVVASQEAHHPQEAREGAAAWQVPASEGFPGVRLHAVRLYALRTLYI